MVVVVMSFSYLCRSLAGLAPIVGRLVVGVKPER